MSSVLEDTLRRYVRGGWARLWMRFAGLGVFGRFASRLAAWSCPPFKGRHYLASISERGYVSPTAVVYHPDLRLGKHVLIGDRATIYHAGGGGPVELGDRVTIYDDCLVENGEGARVVMGPDSRLNRWCQVVAYKADIRIGKGVGIGAGSALFSYNHGIAPGQWYAKQPVESKGPIVIGDYAWIGACSVVLDGVRIGEGAIIGAGSVVTRDIPDEAIAVGVPARVVKMRRDLAPTEVAEMITGSTV